MGAGEGDATPALVFTTAGCKHCRRAKAMLKDKGVHYREVDVQTYPELMEELVQDTQWRTVPQIFVRGTFVGGASELDDWIQQGKLDESLKGTQQTLPPEILKLLERVEAESERGSDAEHNGSRNPSAEASRASFERALALRRYAKRMNNEITSFVSDQSATGEEVTDWMLRNLEEVSTGEQAINLGREMQTLSLLNHKTYSSPFDNSKEVYRLFMHEAGPKLPGLNVKSYWTLPTRHAAVVAEELRNKIMALYELALSEDGTRVNYGVLKKSEKFLEYVEATEELQNVDLYAMTVNEKKAFFINIYNALVIHAMVVKGEPSSFLERMFFFTNTKYCIGGQAYSLDDMENGVLRGNRAPASSLLNTRPFSEKDPRRFHAIVPMDPRIHFALVCGAKSCPPIKIYTADNIDKGLEAATAAFLEAEVEVDEYSSTVTLSKIMDWYSEDFGDSDLEKLKWILPHLKGDLCGRLQRVVYGKNFKIKYRKYNWETNSK